MQNRAANASSVSIDETKLVVVARNCHHQASYLRLPDDEVHPTASVHFMLDCSALSINDPHDVVIAACGHPPSTRTPAHAESSIGAELNALSICEEAPVLAGLISLSLPSAPTVASSAFPRGFHANIRTKFACGRRRTTACVVAAMTATSPESPATASSLPAALHARDSTAPCTQSVGVPSNVVSMSAT
eukprot:CAMPEP_0178397010 /NCGR_PEP_ID=MMETSP0689_2-20121128/14024_1 /TAXON_ID=160604 /ORGANISM="Amphidinium massartii, Strain CS-259" /LENGTH=188 /DNA_ID=CAMNT_0020017703 /DNA_START=168 /DNA_END=735 /DNA_ORIENTATION=+